VTFAFAEIWLMGAYYQLEHVLPHLAFVIRAANSPPDLPGLKPLTKWPKFDPRDTR
jgi:hypothetical protein